MAREVDKRKTGKALRRLRRAAERAQAGEGDLSDWERAFVDGVTSRLETYGSAFRDPSKGRLDEALSQKQAQVTRAIEKKTRPRRSKPGTTEGEAKAAPPRPRSSFKPKRPPSRARVRDINEDAPEPAPPEPPRPRSRSPLRLVPGGRSRAASQGSERDEDG